MNLGDRMKFYEGISSSNLIPNLPICIRIDGKAFHSYTRGMKRPYDESLQNLFDLTTKFLVEETNAVIGYTQSDEISLILWNGGIPDSQVFFDGNHSKLVSVIASMATAFFNKHAPSGPITSKPYTLDRERGLAFFDCRVWNVPNPEEAVNMLVWRELDATRNSIQMGAGALYSHNELHQKNTAEMQEMMWQKGVNWNDYPARFKRGGYFRRTLIERKFTMDELAALPPKHDAHKNPDLVIKRHVIEQLDLPPLLKIRNRVAVIFESAVPELYQEEATFQTNKA